MPVNAFARIVAHSADSAYFPTFFAGVSHWWSCEFLPKMKQLCT